MDKTAIRILFGCLVLMAAYGVFKSKSSPLPVLADEGSGAPASYANDLNAEATDVANPVTLSDTPRDVTDLEAESNVPDIDIGLSFPERIKLVQDLLPKYGELKFKGNIDVHGLHPALLKAGVELGHLKDAWLKDPNERKLAFDFYEQCTFDDRLIESVRALCYVNAIEVSVFLKKEDQVLAWTVDNSVQSLASQLMAN